MLDFSTKDYILAFVVLLCVALIYYSYTLTNNKKPKKKKSKGADKDTIDDEEIEELINDIQD